MTMERAGALALILGGVAYAGLMAAHPTHAGGAPLIGSFSLSGVVHATALVMQPVLAFGFLAFSRFLGLDRPLVALALIFYGLAAVFTMAAATMSGLVFPFIAEAAHAPGADIESMRTLARYTTWLNRSFAQVHYDLGSIAILLWSIGWPARTAFDWFARILGFAVAFGILGWHLSGAMNIEARQGALWMTLAHAGFIFVAAAALLRAKP